MSRLVSLEMQGSSQGGINEETNYDHESPLVLSYSGPPAALWLAPLALKAPALSKERGEERGMATTRTDVFCMNTKSRVTFR